MTNLECTVAVLAKHREARQWTDEAVAAELVAQLGLDPAGDAKNATPGPEEEGTDETADTPSTGGRRGRAAASG